MPRTRAKIQSKTAPVAAFARATITGANSGLDKRKILMLACSASLAVFLALQAFAGPGNSGSNSSSGHSSVSNPNAEDGMLTAKLNDLNAAHANLKAFENAAPESMSGKLAAYMEALSEFEDAEADLAEANDEAFRIMGLTENQCNSQFGKSCDEALADAKLDVTAADMAKGEAEHELENAIFALTGETELDAFVEAELHAMLGI